MKQEKFFFIAGCQRSGTTLMRLILESHSSIYCFDEAFGYEILKKGNFQISNSNFKYDRIGFKIPRFSEQLLWSEMSDIDYGKFSNFYNGQPIIFLVRDYRDVVYSMMRLMYDGGETWLKRYGRCILEHYSNSCESSKDINDILEFVRKLKYPDHLVGALYWKFKTDVIFELLKIKIPVYIVSYEKLVADPKSELTKVVKFLGLDWEDALLNHEKFDHKELDTKGLAIGGTNPNVPIHNQSVGLYNGFFSEEILKEMDEIVYETNNGLSFLIK